MKNLYLILGITLMSLLAFDSNAQCDFDAGPDSSICYGDTMVMNPTAISGAYYVWYPGTGLSSTTIRNPKCFATADSTTYYIAAVSATCTVYDTITIYVDSTPVSTYSNQACLGDAPFPLTTIPPGIKFTGTHVSGGTFNPTALGSYPIEIIGESKGGGTGCGTVKTMDGLTLDSLRGDWDYGWDDWNGLGCTSYKYGGMVDNVADIDSINKLLGNGYVNWGNSCYTGSASNPGLSAIYNYPSSGYMMFTVDCGAVTLDTIHFLSSRSYSSSTEIRVSRWSGSSWIKAMSTTAGTLGIYTTGGSAPPKYSLVIPDTVPKAAAWQIAVESSQVSFHEIWFVTSGVQSQGCVMYDTITVNSKPNFLTWADSSCGPSSKSSVHALYVTGGTGSYEISLDSGMNWEAGTAGTKAYFGGLDKGFIKIRDAVTKCEADKVLGWTSACALPVDMAGFFGMNKGTENHLFWHTETELNNDRFVVERSIDGQTFEPIGVVKGAGTTAEKQSYTFIDEAPAPGENYYRLKQVDFDGTETYTQTITVITNAEDMIRVSNLVPNPATETVSFNVFTEDSRELEIKFSNSLGQTVKQETVTTGKGGISLTYDIRDLAQGVYLIEVSNGIYSEVLKLIVE